MREAKCNKCGKVVSKCKCVKKATKPAKKRIEK